MRHRDLRLFGPLLGLQVRAFLPFKLLSIVTTNRSMFPCRRDGREIMHATSGVAFFYPFQQLVLERVLWARGMSGHGPRIHSLVASSPSVAFDPGKRGDPKVPMVLPPCPHPCESGIIRLSPCLFSFIDHDARTESVRRPFLPGFWSAI
jgi:hypothetical protein